MSTTNVLLIVLDDIGVEWFDFYGIGAKFTTDPSFRYATTPSLSALVGSGVVFTQAHANPICGPTRSCIQTGRHAFRTGFGENIQEPMSTRLIGHRLADSWVWLPAAIEAARPGVYAKAAIGKWHLADGYSSVVTVPFPPPDANLDHPGENGYDFSAIHLPNYGGSVPWFRVMNGMVDPPGGFQAPPFDRSVWAPSVHVTDALGWISKQAGPWFLYLAFNPPHAPFTVPPFDTLSAATRLELEAENLLAGESVSAYSADYSRKSLVFRAAMESVDTMIGELLAGLAPTVRAQTVVLVSGDNGTVMEVLPPGFLHAKRSVYGGGTRVPFLASGPGIVAPGRMTTALAHVVDLYATTLDLVGASMPLSIIDFDGVSLRPVLEQSGAPRNRVFTEMFRPWGETSQVLQVDTQRALFDGRWRYVQRGATEELYDNDADPLESTNVAAPNPAIVAQFRRELDDLLGS